MKVVVIMALGVVLGAIGARAFQPLPVEFLICDYEGNHCDVKARFADRDGCEFHLRFMTAICTTNDADLSAVCKFGRPSLATKSLCQ